jgi:uncharacterized membrane protein YdfJ with MMPL/SSD domain
MFGMMFASISTLIQAGFIIGTGLLLDTFVVRTITVPAIAVLVGKWNWWPSKPPAPRPAARHPKPEPAPAATVPESALNGNGNHSVGRHVKSEADAAAIQS